MRVAECVKGSGWVGGWWAEGESAACSFKIFCSRFLNFCQEFEFDGSCVAASGIQSRGDVAFLSFMTTKTIRHISSNVMLQTALERCRQVVYLQHHVHRASSFLQDDEAET